MSGKKSSTTKQSRNKLAEAIKHQRQDPPQLRKKFHIKDLLKVFPKTETQTKLFSEWEDSPKKNFLLSGSAGTGKTFLSLYLSLKDLLTEDSNYDKIYIIRSIVSSRDIGFLPGDISEKIGVYEAPYSSICDELFSYSKSYENLKAADKIEFVPSSFLRGTTYSNCIIIVDEAQNCSWQELYAITTRVGENCKIIFCGDLKQNDLTKSKHDVSGFDQFTYVISRMSHWFTTLSFTRHDIVRSKLVKDFIITIEELC